MTATTNKWSAAENLKVGRHLLFLSKEIRHSLTIFDYAKHLMIVAQG
jgi:hypothetical protein